MTPDYTRDPIRHPILPELFLDPHSWRIAFGYMSFRADHSSSTEIELTASSPLASLILQILISLIVIIAIVMKKIPVDSYVLETLMADLVGHDRSPSAFLVYLYLWRCTLGQKKASSALSLQEIAEGTGLSKSAVLVFGSSSEGAWSG